ncbi:hypothetical protein [Sinomonas mesophila]|uniref:hypothetical protein n=1 Tax=Sinomonas mesophila TaxID=1531955 RepID=UPI0009872C85|nr:hypothetical protein [Sinomonas mesophila]
MPSTQHPVSAAPTRAGAAAAGVRRVIAVVRRCLSRLPQPDDERIAQHRDTVYRRVQRLPLA